MGGESPIQVEYHEGIDECSLGHTGVYPSTTKENSLEFNFPGSESPASDRIPTQRGLKARKAFGFTLTGIESPTSDWLKLTGLWSIRE